MQKHKIVFLGAGNVAHHLSAQFYQAGHQILQVYNRSITSAERLAERYDCEATDDLVMLDREATLFVIAVSDDAIAELAEQLNLGDIPVVHTSASVSMEKLAASSEHYGVFYPLQTLTTDVEVDFKEVPILIEASDERTGQLLLDLGKDISENVFYLKEAKRQALHVAATFVNNFPNRLFAVANEILQNEELDFALLKPLVKETVRKLEDHDPQELQTGPAKRKDLKTLDAHLRYLEQYPDFKEIYLVLTESILQRSING